MDRTRSGVPGGTVTDIYIHISATVPPGTPGRVRSILLVVWCLMFVCFKGPTACYLHNSHPRFRAFFGSLFLMTFWSQMVIPTEAKIGQNHKKSCSRGLPESTLKKDTKNHRKSLFPGRLDMQSAHACAVQTHFFVFTFQWPKASKKELKSFPKWSLWAPKLKKKQKNKHSKKH